MWWKSSRKNLKSWCSSSMAKAPASLMLLVKVTWVSDVVKTVNEIYSVLKHSVDGSAVKVPSDVAGCWQSTSQDFIKNICPLGGSEKKAGKSNQCQKKNSHFGNVRGGLLHYQAELMCVAVDRAGIWLHIFYFPLNTCSSTPHHHGNKKPTQRTHKISHSLLFWTVCDSSLWRLGI